MSSKLVRTIFRPVCTTIFMGATLFSNISIAATWQEQGDAGSLLNSAQSIFGVGNADTIKGRVSARSDVDLYKINISDPSVFSAAVTGGGNIEGDRDWNSKLWLFDENGFGIFANDNAEGGNAADAVLPGDHPSGPQVAGIYFLAISDDDINPISGSLDDLIFTTSTFPFTSILTPQGQGGSAPLTDWRIPGIGTDKNYDNANYSIALNGAELLTSPDQDSQIEFIERFYLNILGRASDEEGLNYWLNIIQESGAKVAFGFFGSNEFLAMDLDNPQFVKILYSTMFDRDPDEEGLKFWMSNLDAGYSREEVIYGFVSSNEFAELANSFNVIPISDAEEQSFLINNFVQRFYQQVLNREPDAEGNNYWTSKLTEGSETGGNIARGFFESREFINRQTTDSEFVNIIYQAFFGREPDSAGKQNWLDRLAAGTTREEVVNNFIGSQEFSDLADRFGIIAN